MIEATFPLVGAVFVIFLLLPLSALVARVCLDALDGGGVLHRQDLRFVLLVGSSFLPLIWAISAGVHQTERGVQALGCLFDHGSTGSCSEPAFFAALLALVMLAVLCAVHFRSGHVRRSSSSRARSQEDRAARLIDATPSLRELRGRLVVTDDEGFAIGTRGWLAPRLYLGVEFSEGLSDALLEGALAHEREHVVAKDPLRYLVLEVALMLNPLGAQLLRQHADRWLGSREAHCDRAAVLRGARPLDLADAIVQAARPSAREVAALGAKSSDAVKYRVGMLVAFTEKAPRPCCNETRFSAAPLGIVLLLVALFLPHSAGTAALDLLHSSAEHALTSLFWQ